MDKNDIVKGFKTIQYSLKNLVQRKETPYSLLKGIRNKAIETIDWKLTEISLNRYLKKLGKEETPLMVGKPLVLKKTLEKLNYVPRDDEDVPGFVDGITIQNEKFLRRNKDGKLIQPQDYYKSDEFSKQ